MKTAVFYKYQGTGNDFIIFDNRQGELSTLSTSQVAAFCDRRFGIGADGLILLEKSLQSDFRMKYYNSDGNESSMCGNGGRCITAFANYLRITGDFCRFDAIDGLHEARMIKKGASSDIISLKMNDVLDVGHDDKAYIIDTGSPHYVVFCKDTSSVDLISEARKVRYSDRYREKGINVNFVAGNNGTFNIRTYERGVEDETYSCGTGTVAAALAVHFDHRTNTSPVRFLAPGGQLEVSFKNQNGHYTDIWLTGEATRVFEGTVSL